MATRQRNRTAPFLADGTWFTVETVEGVAVGDVNGVFDFDTEDEALAVVATAAVELARPLMVVKYGRGVLDTYAAVTKIEKVKSD